MKGTNGAGVFYSPCGRFAFRSEALLLVLFSVFLFFVLSFFVGNRDFSVGTDTGTYLQYYHALIHGEGNIYGFEPVFYGISWLCSILGLGEVAYLAVLSFLQFVLLVFLAFRVANFLGYGEERFKFAVVFLAFFVASPFFWAAQLNTVRQGVAAILIFFAFFSVLERHFFWFLFFSVVAAGFHYSAVLFASLAPLVILRARVILFFSFFLFLVYSAGVSMFLVEWGSSAAKIPAYNYIIGYAAEAEYRSGVRIDFAVFSLLVPFCVYFLHRFLGWSPERVSAVVGICLVLMVPFWMFGWANFSDRYCYYSWVFFSCMLAVTFFSLFRFFSFGVLSFMLFISSGLFLLNVLNGFAGVIS